MPYTPSYRKLSLKKLRHRAAKARERLISCHLCPHACRVNRLQGEKGRCRSPAAALISSYNAHFGEEPPLVGLYGSGTIFFTHCNLSCVFCQNWEISHGGAGREVSARELAAVMLELQEKQCHNINLVTPTPHIAAILEALALAAEKGLQIPLVYNTGGYETVETLRLLAGIVDLYLPDFKYWNQETARRYSGPPDYPQQAKKALLEMQKQVGDLKTDSRGIAYRGLLVRHLILPANLAGTENVVRFLAEKISPRCAVNIMGQYYPAYKAAAHPPLNRPLLPGELHRAQKTAARAGLRLLK
ncbi:MAG: radical SAM protein [Firmicutes bacterium]|nr:radical SAM protein [Bacillota bacterium]